MSGDIRYGTSSFSSKDWVGPFYKNGTQPTDYLREYARSFDTVEIDSTYYSIPSVDTVKGWVGKTPDGFLISAKFPRSIVHAGKDRIPNPDDILVPEKSYPIGDRFLKTMDYLENRLGILILQFPYFSKKVFPSKDIFMERLDRFLGDLPSGFSYGVEIRNKSWLNRSFAEMLRKHNVSLVLVDHAWMPHPDEIADRFDLVTSDKAYVRLIGDRKEIEAITKSWDKEVIDRDDRLKRWADFLVNNLNRAIQTLVYINNHFAGHAPATLRKLMSMVAERQAV
jgi:uncharacterized protein YecE (DUF72 family)